MRRCVHHVLVWCQVCDRFIAHESTHRCTLIPKYRFHRDAVRAAKTKEITHARH